MKHLLAFTISEAIWTSIIINAVVVFGVLAKGVFDILNRIQDRKDRAQLAEMTVRQLAVVEAAGAKRGKEIIREVVKTRSVATRGVIESKKAIEVGNGHNQKIADLTENVKAAVETISAAPIKVHVDNLDQVASPPPSASESKA